MRIYASAAPYGGNVVGLEAAGWRWFGRSAAELSWAEAATLAVLPNNPALVHPGSRREELLAKRDALLRRLAAAGRLRADELRLALVEELPEEPYALPRLAPQLLDRVKEAAADRGGARDPAKSLVRTSVDRGLQAQVSSIIDRQVARFAGNGIRNAACVVLDVATGEALAYVGNASIPETAGSSPFVDLAVAPRSSGSILKPFLYAALLESGEMLPDSLVLDVPTRIGGYLPENNVRGFAGAVPASEALARSLNIPAVRELRGFGVDRFAALLRGLGLTTLFRQASDYGLPLILGGAEVTLWEITGLYAGLARTALSTPGSGREAAFSRPTWTSGGPSTAGSATGKGNPYSAASAWLTLEALLEVARPGEDAAWQEYASGRRIAWKTGTSFGFRDAWAVGVTPRYAVGVWVGNASGEGRPELRGILNAAPILFEVFSSLPAAAWFPEPYDELVPVTVCAKSGYLAGPFCAETAQRLVPRAGAASAPCPYCRPVTLDLAGRYQVTVPETPSLLTKTENRFVLPPTVEWFYRKQHYEYRSLPPFRGGGAQAIRSFSVMVPTEGAVLYAPVEISGSEGQLVFEAAATSPESVLYWHLDDEYLGLTKGDHRIECRPAAGKHTLTVVDDRGASETLRFTVLSK
jgi:penicillin-binding protein 1C